jgi:hypothetical protein
LWTRSFDRKSFVSGPAAAGRRVVLVAWWALAIALVPFSSAPAAAQVTLKVAAFHGLPGLHHSALSRFIAAHMTEAGLADWRFEPSTGAGIAADRVEWNFTLHPYAGREVRRFADTLSSQPRPGTHHPVTIEASLYLHGVYQTLVEAQATIQGGACRFRPRKAVVRVTQDLLGPHGAYRAIHTRQLPTHRENSLGILALDPGSILPADRRPVGAGSSPDPEPEDFSCEPAFFC